VKDFVSIYDFYGFKDQFILCKMKITKIDSLE